MAKLIVLSENSDYADPQSIESSMRVEIVKLFAENNSLKTLVLYHDMSYEDLTGSTMSTGTFKIGSDSTYTLTDEFTEAETTLTVNADGTATLGEMTLSNKIAADREFKGTVSKDELSIGGDAESVLGAAITVGDFDVTLSCNGADNTYSLGVKVTVAAADMTLDLNLAGGTFVEDTDPVYADMIPKFEFTPAADSGVTAAIEREFD